MARVTRRTVYLAAVAALVALAAVLPAGAAQAASPSAITGAAQQVGPTGALINGTVNPGGKSTTAFFEYGTDPSNLTKTASSSVGSGTADVPVSATLSGLTPGTTYTYLVEATNADGSAKGVAGTFTTLSAPGVVTGSASGIGATSATLNGSVDANGRATSWYFEYGTSTSYGTRTATKSAGSGGSPQSESASLTNLKLATVYHYRLVASNSAGTTHGADRTFSTSVPPGVQTGAAQSVGVTTVTLTGAVDPNTRSTTWWFEYGTSTAYGSKTSSQSAGSGSGAKAVSAGLKGLVSGATYHYRLVAKSDAGTTTGADVAFQTAGVTLTAAARDLTFGRAIVLHGAVPMRSAGQPVTVFAQPYGTSSFQSIAVVLTSADGSWAYLAKPTINTAYRALWQGGTSAAVSVGVHPAVGFTRKGVHFNVRVNAGRGFPHRVVQLQRRTAAGRWLTIKRIRLGVRSRAEFTAVLPHGRSVLRMAFSVNQAGVGYLGGISRTIVVSRG